jgi:hypothetical protein
MRRIKSPFGRLGCLKEQNTFVAAFQAVEGSFAESFSGVCLLQQKKK